MGRSSFSGTDWGPTSTSIGRPSMITRGLVRYFRNQSILPDDRNLRHFHITTLTTFPRRHHHQYLTVLPLAYSDESWNGIQDPPQQQISPIHLHHPLQPYPVALPQDPPVVFHSPPPLLLQNCYQGHLTWLYLTVSRFPPYLLWIPFYFYGICVLSPFPSWFTQISESLTIYDTMQSAVQHYAVGSVFYYSFASIFSTRSCSLFAMRHYAVPIVIAYPFFLSVVCSMD